MDSKSIYFGIVALIVSILFISGCIPEVQEEAAAKGGAGAEKEPPAQEEAAKEAEKELTTTITPARDLSGIWQGSATWHDNVGNPACSYEGTIRFSFTQNSNQLTGTFQTTITKANKLLQSVPCSPAGTYPSAALAGTISSTAAKFSSGTIDFSATFTTDLMQGTFESCPDQLCSDGTRAVGTIGEFSATRQG